MTPRQISEAVSDHFLAAPLDDDQLEAVADRTIGREPDDNLEDHQARTVTDAFARLRLAEAGVDEGSPHWDALAQAAVRTVVDGEPVELTPVPGIVWGHERQAATARAVDATRKFVSKRMVHQAAWELRTKLQEEGCQDVSMLGAAANAVQRAVHAEKAAERWLYATLESLDAEELQAGLVQVSKPLPGLSGEKQRQTHLAATQPWQQILEATEADPRSGGGAANRTATMRLLQGEVTELENALAAARAKRDEIVRQSTGTTNYRIARATGLSKPGVAKIRASQTSEESD